MSHERTGKRALNYSKWHRPESISRFIDQDEALSMTMMDVDSVETNGSFPLVLIESARYSANYDADKAKRSWQINTLRNLAKYSLLGIEAYLVLYELRDEQHIAQHKYDNSESYFDIKKFHVKRLYPESTSAKFIVMSPREYARFILEARHRVSSDIRRRVNNACTRGLLNL